MRLLPHESAVNTFPNVVNGVPTQGNGSGQSRCFTFDKVFETEATQQDIYDGANVDSMVKNVIEGFHSTIFCYG